MKRSVLLVGLSVALAACGSKTTTTDGATPPPVRRDTMSTTRPDTMRMQRDTVRRDTTGMTPKNQ